MRCIAHSRKPACLFPRLSCQSLHCADAQPTVGVSLTTCGHCPCVAAAVQVEYLATRLSSLLVMPDSRQALLRLPEPLLRQLLSSEAVDVEQVCVGDQQVHALCWTHCRQLSVGQVTQYATPTAHADVVCPGRLLVTSAQYR